MRTPREIYEAYKILPNLQLHQLRVAAVGKLICDNSKNPVNTSDVLLECLFHDMGNIIKSDLSYFPDFVQPEGLEYWQAVKDDFLKRYGTEQHAANAAIAREIGLPERVAMMMDQTGFSRMETILQNGSFEVKVCQYADSRVGPHGVLSLDERLTEGRERYVAGKKGRQYYDSEEGFEKLARAVHKLEEEVFAHISIRPEDTNDLSAAPVIEQLWEYPVA